MVLLVDGYNVIKYLLPHNRREHNGQRKWLIARMATYFVAKRAELDQVIVVFDGGMSRHRHREVHRKIVILFAGHQWCADEVLVEYCEQYQGSAVVVTNDRELSRRCGEHGAQVVKVDEFDELCSRVERTQKQVKQQKFGSITVTKLSDEEDIELDALMEAASLGGTPLDKDESPDEVRPQGAKKKKKAERARDRLRDRLG